MHVKRFILGKLFSRNKFIVCSRISVSEDDQEIMPSRAINGFTTSLELIRREDLAYFTQFQVF